MNEQTKETPTSIMHRANRLAEDNLENCCREMIRFQDTGCLEDGIVRRIARLVSVIEPAHSMALAQALINHHAIRRVANG